MEFYTLFPVQILYLYLLQIVKTQLMTLKLLLLL